MKDKSFLYATAFVVAMIVFHLICAATGNDVTTNAWRIIALAVESIVIIILQYGYHLADNNNKIARLLATVLIANSTAFILYFSNQTFTTMFITLINIFTILIGTFLYSKHND